MRRMKKKKFFRTGIAFSILAVAIMISSAAAVPVLNKASNSLEIEEDNISSSIEVNDEIYVDSNTHLTENDDVFEETVDEKESNTAEQLELDNNQNDEKPELSNNPEEGELALGVATLNIHVEAKEKWYGDYLPLSGADVQAFPFVGFGLLRLVVSFDYGLVQNGVTNDEGNCQIEAIAPQDPYAFPYVLTVTNKGFFNNVKRVIGIAFIEQVQAEKTYYVEIKCQCKSSDAITDVEQSICEESEAVLLN